MPEGELKRLKIEAFRQADCQGTAARSFEVMMNPNTYSQKYEAQYQARQGAGNTSSPQVFEKIKPQDYSFELLFDGTGTAVQKVAVKEKLDEFLAVAALPDSELHRPMYLKLSWGTLTTRCVLKSAEITYTLFNPDGTPLRARVRAAFSEFEDDQRRVARERKASPDLTHVHTVRSGEHLSQLTNHYYGDPSRYLQVAAYNALDNFRELQPGQTLVFPPIQDKP
jgi:hypothetical protein